MNGESQKILSGNFEAWVYQTLGGINYDPEHPGFKHIVLRPRPVGDLTFVRASHRSLYGPIVSDWKIERRRVPLGRDDPAEHDGDGLRARARREGRGRRGQARLGQAEGVRFLRREGGATVYELGSGTYRFRAPRRGQGRDGPRDGGFGLEACRRGRL